ncbi:L-lactate dehydrogenase complex protein LldG [Planifilum fimeticola]|jgi:L-lactate dehydrogenase complex protein LldG|uniref:L-lactate dehydrogenase complex protein LldG n=1 Tax=Planifilum fimeticola TaxID=201975 RepID=A0A2T0LCI9_9BACL|nr:lactate utilization protein C [Planifilum fimeticola]PRX39723.1 L-lactate dehydrogenase complex protein LldG [Planifilum fimeticola]
MMDHPDGRRRFLSRLSERLGENRRNPALPPEESKREETMAAEERMRRFLHNLSLLGGRGIRVQGREALRRQLMEDIDREKGSSLVFWKDPLLEEVTADLSGVERILWDPGRDSAAQIRDAARAAAGLVRADWGVASTGSIVLRNGEGRGRSVSLLPPVLFAVLERENIVAETRSVWARIGEGDGGGVPACINWITGPSRSADIEGDLSIGVHGPYRVVVYLLE